MKVFRSPARHGYAVEVSPFLPNRVACASSQFYGITGCGTLLLLNQTDTEVVLVRSQEQENSNPESLTFKERQRLFSQGKEVSNKVKASRKLMELENELNTKQ